LTGRFSFRAAKQEDFIFCERVYFENMDWIIEALDLHRARHREGFAVQWQLAEVRIITVGGEDVGWLQTESADDVVFLKQLYLDALWQRQGIGSEAPQVYLSKRTRGAGDRRFRVGPGPDHRTAKMIGTIRNHQERS